MHTGLDKHSATDSDAKRANLTGILRSAYAVFEKDLRCEFRVKSALSAIILFAVTSTIVISFTLQSYGGNAAVSSTLLWLVIYFSAMVGLSRSFVREEETGTAANLRLSVPAESVYLGKLAFNWALVTALQCVTVPLFLLFMNSAIGNAGQFACVLILGGLGISAGATSASAMVAKAATKGAVFAVICFPLLIPALAISIHGSNIAMAVNGSASATNDIKLLIAFSGTIITASLMLFRFIWEN